MAPIYNLMRHCTANKHAWSYFEPIKSQSNEVVEVEDFDNGNDIFQVPQYVEDIFKNLKLREKKFYIKDYISMQEHISEEMRTLLVDWMVEMQVTFELNHETLYLAVKIVDLYLSKVIITKDRLQLLGATALFIAAKYEEHTPTIEDFLTMCGGSYVRQELVTMEVDTLNAIQFELGIPLSYSFLRRYAFCAKIPKPTLTLARYILEMALMEYSSISFRDSHMAAAALFMALRMHGDPETWNSSLEHYSGYVLADFVGIVPTLNCALGRNCEAITTIRTKYSKDIFHEVAMVPLMSDDELLDIKFNIRNWAFEKES